MTEEDLELALKVTASLGMGPRLLRLLTSVHEAGHAIVGATLGFEVAQARVTCRTVLGVGLDHVQFTARPGFIPLPDLLAVRAAGLEAGFLWLQGRGCDGEAEPYRSALGAMGSDDAAWCEDACRGLGRPDLTMQHGIEGAAWILTWRWHAVLRLAYALAAQGTMTAGDLRPYLYAGPRQVAGALRAYDAWRQQAGPVFRPGTGDASGR